MHPDFPRPFPQKANNTRWMSVFFSLLFGRKIRFVRFFFFNFYFSSHKTDGYFFLANTFVR